MGTAWVSGYVFGEGLGEMDEPVPGVLSYETPGREAFGVTTFPEIFVTPKNRLGQSLLDT